MQFANTIIVDYRFEELQQLKFACYDADNKKEVDNLAKQELIGEVECTMAEIVTAGQKYERKLRLKGNLALNFSFNTKKLLLLIMHVCICNLLYIISFVCMLLFNAFNKLAIACSFRKTKW